METKSLSFDYQAKYHILGMPGPDIEKIWFVLHGYGQLARYFIRKFNSLDDGRHLIIAPEGLSRFYLEGFEGKVGASWMTKEERETDIRNYLTYLNTLGNAILDQYEFKNTHITLLGFSQGAATASRWIAESEIKFDRFILWAGAFPEDLNLKGANKNLSGSDNFLIVGSRDQFLSDKKILDQENFWKKLNITPQVITFDGGHEINQEVLKSFM